MSALVGALSRELIESDPDQGAAIAERFGGRVVAELAAELGPAAGARLLSRVAPAVGADALDALGETEAAAILDELSPHRAAALLRLLDRDSAEARIARETPACAAQVRRLLAHLPDSAGALMDPAVLALAPDVRAADALAAVRVQPGRCRHYLYVVDRAGVLVGVLSFVELIAAGEDSRLGDIMSREVGRLRAADGVAAIRAHPGWQRWRALPVIDEQGALLGAIGRETYVGLQRRAGAAPEAAPLSLALSLAELFWYGLAGMTEGLATAGERARSRRTEGDRGAGV